MGCLTMNKFVLGAIPIYMLSAMEINHKLELDMNKKLRKFLWDGENDSHKISLLV